VEKVQKIGWRKRRVRGLGEPHPWEPQHMRLQSVCYAEAAGGGRRNVALGVIQHLWRAPVAFIGFYAPEGVKITESRIYVPGSLRLVDDSEYLAGVEAHKRAFAGDLRGTMLLDGGLPGYFDIPMDAGWRISLDLVHRRLELTDAWGLASSAEVVGDIAPFAWAYQKSGFCVLTLYDKDLGGPRDDLLFVAKREGVELRWRQRVA
jgi:hypothetical protein